ncbi:MAG TPA: ABC transporter permease [Candidatus Woesebacteria bacterium]|nr:ABC transporter permease [Candidatus Woesebacteria bacterium]HRT39927.1 ABC transporter permease [Candidatus Woesebacteria bacterium]
MAKLLKIQKTSMNSLKHAWHHIRRSPFQSLIACLVMATTFFVFTSFLIISQGLGAVLDYYESKPEISLFLNDGLDKSTVESIQKQLMNYPSVREVKFTSKEKALAIYQEQNKDNPLLTEMVTSSILPASFDVSVNDPKVLETIYHDFTNKKEWVSDIIYQKDIIDQLLNWTRMIRTAGLTAVALLTLSGFGVIFIILNMKITNRKEEINISRLLGASKYFVQKPFLIEGIIYGLSGGIIGTLISLGLFAYLSSELNQFFRPVVFYQPTISSFLLLLSIQSLFGCVIGFISSWFGVKRFTKY